MKTNAFIGIQFILLATLVTSQASLSATTAPKTATTSSKTSTTTVSCSSNSPVGGGKFTYLGTSQPSDFSVALASHADFKRQILTVTNGEPRPMAHRIYPWSGHL